MHRVVFERSLCDGFRTTKVESIASNLAGRRLLTGTGDGSLTAYECRQEMSSLGRSYNCKVLETVRKASKDKKPAQFLTCVESWRVFVGIIDGSISVYDSQFYQHLSTIADSKGCHLFAVNEKQFSIIVVNKKKLSQYTWQQPSFALRKELNLQDVPKTVHFVNNSVIVAYKKFYECIEINSGISSRILDIEKEHKMIILEMPKNPIRPSVFLLSMGLQGVLLNSESVLSGSSFAYGSSDEERIEWSSIPVSVHLMNPFLLSVLSDSSVEVHDLASLASLQRISISSPSPHIVTLTTCSDDPTKCGPPPNFSYHAYVCNGEQLSVLKMIPLAAQVESLVNAQQYEQAINICKICGNAEILVGIDLIGLYESSANAMLAKGDFEKAIQHFIMAKTDFVDVARHFPDLIPLPLHIAFNVYQIKKLAGSVLNRAANAIVQLCQSHRAKIMKRAEKAEKSKESGIIATTSLKTSYKVGMESSIEDEEEYIIDPEEDIRRAQLLDSMYLFALMHCNPVQKTNIIELLSSPNRCQIESCSVLLASHGNAYTEALLWLYRSQSQHSRVIQALTEDKCVAKGAWTTDQFYNWTADYLRWLWYHEEDASLPRQALAALKQVLEYDAELGLSVLVCRPPNKQTFGGKGVTISEVLSFLRSTNPKINYTRTNLSYGSAFATNGTTLNKLKDRGSLWLNEKGIANVMATTPLVNGHALGVAFLECLISSGEAPANMHDEFAQLLVEGLPLDTELGVDHKLNDLEIRSDDTETLLLYKIYRKKLQNFLATSTEYHPHRVLKFLPRQYLHENALVLSRLGRHRDVLKIYLTELNSLELAELYCDKIYLSLSGDDVKLAMHHKANGKLSSNISTTITINNLNDAGQIYLILFEVILSREDGDIADITQNEAELSLVMNLAEKYCERFDTSSFLQLLPPDIGIGALSNYFTVVLENLTSHKRTLQIMHQLLRKREVYLRTNGGNVLTSNQT